MEREVEQESPQESNKIIYDLQSKKQEFSKKVQQSTERLSTISSELSNLGNLTFVF